MKVTFVLPGFKPRPAGGFLVVYRYANELSRRGHDIRIIHPRRVDPPVNRVDGLKAATWRYRKLLRSSGGRPSWFELDPSVEVILVPDLDESRIPAGDAIVATACTTALPVWAFSARAGVKFYLVQHFEDWLCGREMVEATWKLPMHKVVVSNWLFELGVALGERRRLTHIPNGVELETFRILVPPEERPDERIGLLASRAPFKGLTYGIEALRVIEGQVPEVEAVFFGVGPRPDELPERVKYVRNPSRQALVDLYNSVGIFVHTSEAEGFGLPGAEAVACGCALVAADSAGVRDYAVDGKTALVVPPRDPDALAAATTKLIEDSSLRLRLARDGCAAIQRFTWNRAAETLERLLIEGVGDASSDPRRSHGRRNLIGAPQHRVRPKRPHAR